MSKAGVVAVIEKALSDETFKAQLKANPEKALRSFDLTAAEKKAITSGSKEQLKALGLDERLSKSVFDPAGGALFT